MATEEGRRKAQVYLDELAVKRRPFHDRIEAIKRETEQMTPEEYAAWIEAGRKHWTQEELNDYFEGGPLCHGGSIDDPGLLDAWLHGKTYHAD